MKLLQFYINSKKCETFKYFEMFSLSNGYIQIAFFFFLLKKINAYKKIKLWTFHSIMKLAGFPCVSPIYVMSIYGFSLRYDIE